MYSSSSKTLSTLSWVKSKSPITTVSAFSILIHLLKSDSDNLNLGNLEVLPKNRVCLAWRLPLAALTALAISAAGFRNIEALEILYPKSYHILDKAALSSIFALYLRPKTFLPLHVYITLISP